MMRIILESAVITKLVLGVFAAIVFIALRVVVEFVRVLRACAREHKSFF